MSNSTSTRFFGFITALLILIGTIGCKSTETATKSRESAVTQTEKETNATTASEKELEELYWARQDSARMSFTKADVMFMTGMIAHHAQALVMSALAPENEASQSVQTLAARIINAQKDEIRTMQQWLKDRNQPYPKYEIDGLNLTMTIDGEPYTSYRKMRGVLSQDKLIELSKAKGAEFDRLFLKYMIEHHAGAVYMVENLFNKDGAAQDKAAFKLASDIQVDQRTEINRMQLMLDRLTKNGNG